MNPLASIGRTMSVPTPANIRRSISDGENQSKDSADFSRVFMKIDRFLNLGKPDRLSIDHMGPEEQKTFLKVLASLMKEGVVGYEMIEVNGIPEKHYLVTQIGDHRLRGAKPAQDKTIP
jgi:hypothetical protein